MPSFETLREEYNRLWNHPSPHVRGTLFEDLIRRALAFEVEVLLPFSVPGEQIDGAFFYRDSCFLLEVKWQAESVSSHQMDHFQSDVERRPEGTLGLFVSISPFSKVAVERCNRAKRPNVILWTAKHVELFLSAPQAAKELLETSFKELFIYGRSLPSLPPRSPVDVAEVGERKSESVHQAESAEVGGETLQELVCSNSYVSEVVRLARDGNVSVQVEALRAMVDVSDPNCFPHIVALLEHDPSEDVRAAAALAIGALSVPGANGFLVQAFQADNSPTVRAAAVDVIRTLEVPDSAELFIDHLKVDPAMEVRRRCASALGDLRAVAAIDSLIEALHNDTEERVRGRCAIELRHFNVSRVRRALTTALKDPRPGVRRRAAMSLGSIGDQSTIPHLLTLADRETHPVPKQAASEAVVSIRSRLSA